MKRLISLYLIVLFHAALASEPVSGPSYCRKFDIANARKQGAAGNLAAMRNLRDFYVDCALAQQGQEALYWAKLAANIGNKEDKNTYVSLSRAIAKPQSPAK